MITRACSVSIIAGATRNFSYAAVYTDHTFIWNVSSGTWNDRNPCAG